MDMHGFFVAVFISKKCMEIGVWREFFWGGGQSASLFSKCVLFSWLFEWNGLDGLAWWLEDGGGVGMSSETLFNQQFPSTGFEIEHK